MRSRIQTHSCEENTLACWQYTTILLEEKVWRLRLWKPLVQEHMIKKEHYLRSYDKAEKAYDVSYVLSITKSTNM